MGNLLSCPGEVRRTAGTKGDVAMTKAGKVVERLAYLHHLGLHPASLAVLQQHWQKALYLLSGHSHSRSLESYPAARLGETRGIDPIAVSKSLATPSWRILPTQRRTLKIQDLHLLDRSRHSREKSYDIEWYKHDSLTALCSASTPTLPSSTTCLRRGSEGLRFQSKPDHLNSLQPLVVAYNFVRNAIAPRARLGFFAAHTTVKRIHVKFCKTTSARDKKLQEGSILNSSGNDFLASRVELKILCSFPLPIFEHLLTTSFRNCDRATTAA